MSLSAVLHDAAGVEVDDAADYYDLESPGLGTAFIDEVARVIAKLEEYPESAAPLTAMSGRLRSRNSRTRCSTR